MQRDIKAIRSQFSQRQLLLQRLADNLLDEVSESLRSVSHIDRIYFRAKSIDSFAAKAQELNETGAVKYEYPLEEIEDQVAGRVLVFYRSDIATVTDALGANFRPAEKKHRCPSKVNEFDYETTHMIYLITADQTPPGWDTIEDPPRTFELQIRTLAQHAWSAPQHAFYKKREGLTPEALRKLYWAAASAWGMDSIWEQLQTELDKLDSRA